VKGASLATSEIAQPNKKALRRSAMTTADQAVLHKFLLLMEAFRAIRRLMPLQHAYVFVVVALEEGRYVSEYAKRAGTTQSVMTRILFALGSHSRGREAGYGLVHQEIDPHDARKTQTFLTVRGKTLVHEIVRLMRSDRQRAMRLRKLTERSRRDLEYDQWFSRLIDTGRKLGTDDIRLVVRQVEALIGHRQSTRPPHRRRHRASTSL
jgi:DNA-binding MarR family transcriptional regulator